MVVGMRMSLRRSWTSKKRIGLGEWVETGSWDRKGRGVRTQEWVDGTDGLKKLLDRLECTHQRCTTHRLYGSEHDGFRPTMFALYNL